MGHPALAAASERHWPSKATHGVVRTDETFVAKPSGQRQTVHHQGDAGRPSITRSNTDPKSSGLACGQQPGRAKVGSMSLSSAAGRLTAVLGPTNTGKTYLAIERMLGHESGMIGFPLRLLARENYDRIVQVKGASQVALITGEEKIAPPGARYFVCTVEIHAARPHGVVPRRRRGADGGRSRARPLLHRPAAARARHARDHAAGRRHDPPGAEPPAARHRRRGAAALLKLTYVGPKKATRLPRRSAVVGFSANEVYAIAELIRRQRGGTAIVMGAHEPAHAQRPGRHVPVGRGRLPGGDRRHRHGPQHGREPRLVRIVAQI